MDGWMDRWMDGWMHGCMDGWMDGWMGRCTTGKRATALIEGLSSRVLWVEITGEWAA
jgi:hypothetical protein